MLRRVFPCYRINSRNCEMVGPLLAPFSPALFSSAKNNRVIVYRPGEEIRHEVKIRLKISADPIL